MKHPIITATASAVASTTTSTIGTGVALISNWWVAPLIIGVTGIVIISVCCGACSIIRAPGATFVAPEELELVALDQANSFNTLVVHTEQILEAANAAVIISGG